MLLMISPMLRLPSCPLALFPQHCVSLSGFALGIALFIAARRLLARRKLGRVVGIARWSMVHHVAVVVAFLIASFGMSEDFWLLTPIPCVIGLALGFGLHRRARLEVG